MNAASVEYARAVTPWVRPEGPQVLTCLFCVEREGRLRQPATEAKAARGTFIGVTHKDELSDFRERGYAFDLARSDSNTLVFTQSRPAAV